MITGYAFMAAETGTLVLSPSALINLSDTAINWDNMRPSRTFYDAAADTSTFFATGSKCNVCVANPLNAAQWAIYRDAVYANGTPNTLTLSSAVIVGQQGTLTNGLSVSVWAVPPMVVNDFAVTDIPGSDDDETMGFHKGSIVKRISTDRMYVCTSAAEGAATWEYWDTTLVT